MRYLHSTLWLFAVAAALFAQTASGEDNDLHLPCHRSPSRSRVVVGESCTVNVDRDGASLQFEGEFVKSSHRWIVLRRISESRNDVSVPISSKVPFVTRKNPKLGCRPNTCGFPRQFAAVVSHAPAERNVPLEHPLGEVPTPGARAPCQS